MKNIEINPRLKKELDHIQEVPERGLQASHAARENYLAQVRTMKPRPIQTKKAGRRAEGVRRRSWVSRFAVIAAVFLVALSSIGGTVYAAQASGPEDMLYGVKTLTEDIWVGLESDPGEKLDLITLFADRRLSEIEAQAAAGEPISERALDRLEKHTQQMLDQAAQMGVGNIENALRQVQQSLELQNQVMTKLQQQTPGGGEPGLVKAQEEVQSRLRLVENGINEPQGFQEQMRIENSDQPGKGSDNSDSPGNSDQAPGSDSGDGQPGNGNGPGAGGK